jgi:DNA-binding transcriptional regulator YiaG
VDNQLFEDLVLSIKQAGAISRGEVVPSQSFTIEDQDVRAIREGLQLSQSEFANLMRVNVRTLQNWEQRRRRPTGPAAALLKIVATAPHEALRALHS